MDSSTTGKGLRLSLNSEVINIRASELRKQGYRSLQEWLDISGRHVYIGGKVQYVKGSHQSIWANPFSVNDYGRDECMSKYEAYVRSSQHLLGKLPELRGKTLGCWCAPEACHGDVLVKLIKELERFVDV